MILYHGSAEIIQQPRYHGGSRRNDYGYGFYCTRDAELAKEWACQKDTDGYANRYSFSDEGLQVVDLNGPGFSILNWLAILAANRSYWERSAVSEQAKAYLQEHFLPDLSSADVICGYRADDSYFSFARAFVANAITVEQLSRAMRLGNLGEQVVLVSKQAFSRIKWLDAEPAAAKEFFGRSQARESVATREYRRMVREEPFGDGLFMADIMRRGLTNADFL